MPESSFEMDLHRRSAATHRQHHTTPVQSPPLSFFSPQTHPFPTSHRTRYRRVPPTSPFASDDDRSWQDEISWQAEPISWKQNRADTALGAALSPWTGPPPTPTPSPVNTRRSAKDFYASGVSSGDLNFRNFTNPYYEYSNALSPGRIELQSHETNHQPHSTSFIGDYMKSPTFARMEAVVTKRTHHFLDDEDDIDDEIRTNKQESRWFSVSCAHFDGDHSPLNGISFRSDDHHDINHGYDDDYYNDGKITHTPKSYVYDGESDDGDDEVAQQKTMGIFGLFKYSTKFDLFLIIIGCLGALINGGSLPWYSYLFGNFVNKIALENDKDQMIKDVRKVNIF
ncbi:hypothetical protein R6Q59_036251 [Mikania micrantha]